MAKWQQMGPTFQSVLRVVAAAMFILHGTMKLFAYPTGVTPDGGAVQLMSQIGLAGVLEVGGGAFLLSGEMAVAYFQFHFPQGSWPLLTGGEVPALYAIIWLYFSAAGPGPLSLDAKLKQG